LCNIYKERWADLHPHEHLHLFSKRSLKILLHLYNLKFFVEGNLLTTFSSKTMDLIKPNSKRNKNYAPHLYIAQKYIVVAQKS